MTPWYANALGPLTQPWALVAAGVSVIVEAKLASWQDYLTLALFCVIATSAFLAMEIYAGFRPQPAQQFLARLRHCAANGQAALKRPGRARLADRAVSGVQDHDGPAGHLDRRARNAIVL